MAFFFADFFDGVFAIREVEVVIGVGSERIKNEAFFDQIPSLVNGAALRGFALTMKREEGGGIGARDIWEFRPVFPTGQMFCKIVGQIAPLGL